MKSNNKFDPSEVIGFYITAVWLAFWFGILYLGFDANRKNIGDLGAYISGIFAPIAWLWFYLSYRLQREELKLQRQTLETQVEELKHSVQAQQGSEAALKEQSEALKKQLEITSRQFEYWLEDRRSQRPLFKVVDYQLFTKLPDSSNYPISGFGHSLPQIPDYFRIILSNHRANCTIKDVRPQSKLDNHTFKMYPNLEINRTNPNDRFNNKENTNSEYITISIKSFEQLNDRSKYEDKVLNDLNGWRIVISYAYAETSSSSDIYEFYLDEGELKTRLLEGD